MTTTPEQRAAKLPPPTPGLRIERMSLEVLCEYLNMHGLEVERVIGGTIIVRKMKGDSLVDVAKQLSEIGD